jgi:hypothetical protein
MEVRVHEPRQYRAAPEIDALRARRHGDVGGGADRCDPLTLDNDARVLQGRPAGAVDEAHAPSSTSTRSAATPRRGATRAMSDEM